MCRGMLLGLCTSMCKDVKVMHSEVCKSSSALRPLKEKSAAAVHVPNGAMGFEVTTTPKISALIPAHLVLLGWMPV